MTTENPNADFYLTKRKDTPYWSVRFRDPVTRDILTAISSRCTNKIRAKAWAEAEYARRADVALHPMTVREYATNFYSETCEYVAKQRSDKGISEKTRISKRRYVVEYVLADKELMDARLAEITRQDVERFRARLIASRFDGTPSRTSQAVIEVLKTILGQAVEHGLIAQNPIFRLPTGRYEYTERDALTEEELDTLMKRANFGSGRQYIATMIAAATGMRAGEVRALKWKDIDKNLRIIRIDRALDQDSITEHLPKWGKKRACPYPAILENLLEPLRGKPDVFVFEWEGGALNYQRWKTTFARACRKVGIDTTLHGLRHTLNTLLLQRGISDAVIRAALGWSDPKIQERYSHINFGGGYRSLLIDSVVEAIKGRSGTAKPEGGKTDQAGLVHEPTTRGKGAGD